MMGKYYVSCGPIRVVLAAHNSADAALSAVARALEPEAWIYDDPGLTAPDCRAHLMVEALLRLEPSIRVSEKGFAGDDSVWMGTPETVDRWHRMQSFDRRGFRCSEGT